MSKADTVLYIFGGTSTAVEVRETATLRLGESFVAVFLVVPENEHSDEPSRIPIGQLPDHVREIRAKAAGPLNAGFLISMSEQRVRSDCLTAAESAGLSPTNVIHPTAVISPSARIGRGVYIAANSVVSSEAQLEDHVIVNYQVTVGHHSRIGEHTMLNPGARVGGNCVIGKRVLVGANSMILQGKRVGDDTLIDAMTYIDRDIEAGNLCASRNLRVVKRPGFGRQNTGNNRTYVIGCGGHARVVCSMLQELEMRVCGILDDDPKQLGEEVDGVPVIGPISKLGELPSHPVAIAIGDNARRREIANQFERKSPALIHPTAVVDRSAMIGEGSVIMAGAVIQAGAVIGEHVIVNTSASIDHDCRVGAFAHLCPGSRLAGGVSLGPGVLYGTGAVSIPYRSVGEWSIVGAGSVVIRDIPPRVVAYGNPARVMGSVP